MHIVVVESFHKSVSRPHDSGSPNAIEKGEVDVTMGLIDTLLAQVEQCTP